MNSRKRTNVEGVRPCCALDINDSVGIIDSYFPEAEFFTEHERFDRHLEKLQRTEQSKIDYISICTPNHLHDAQIRHALRVGADAICEKPLVLNPWNVEALQQFESERERKIHCILQLRLHPAIIALKKQVENGPPDKIYDIDLSYITSRGKWYFSSWKSIDIKSGGIAANIGIHFFDMLTWIFGPEKSSITHVHNIQKTGGYLQLKKANVRWFLSIDYDDIPQNIKEIGQRTFRSITVDKREIEFSSGFGDLHTTSYKHILNGKGFTIGTTKPSIDIAYKIRTNKPVGLKGDYHPFFTGCKIKNFKSNKGY